MEQYDIKTNFHQQYKLMRQIAEESSGNVHLCSNRVTDVVFAVKILKSQKPLTSSYTQLNEMLVVHELRQHNHPSIMRIVGVFADFDINEILFVSSVAEEDLFATITRKKKLTVSETQTVFKQLFSAIEFLVSLPLFLGLVGQKLIQDSTTMDGFTGTSSLRIFLFWIKPSLYS